MHVCTHSSGDQRATLDTFLQVLATHSLFQLPLTGLKLTNYTKTHLPLTSRDGITDTLQHLNSFLYFFYFL